MFRLLVVILTLTVFATFNPVAHAQPGKGLPLAPGVHPGSPIGPGMQFLPQPTPKFAPPVTGFGSGLVKPTPIAPFGPAFVTPVFVPAPFYGFGFGYGGFGPYGYGYGLGYGFGPPVLGGPSAMPVQPTDPGVVLANEFPAVLTVQYPTPAEVWLNGKKLEGKAEEHQLISPVLKPGETFTFEVKARWKVGEKTYESTRTVTLSPGDRSRLLVISGTEVTK
jgi:uncharacterized protein (TIGR03000 family)